MTPTAALIRKEARAIAPLAVATAVAVAAAGQLGGDLSVLGPVAYAAGSMAIGAAMIGHELAHGTLGGLLSQPVARGWVLRAKLLVTACALAIVAGAAAWTGVLDGLAEPGALTASGALALVTVQAPVFLMALFLAPWLTMLTRNALAGAVGALVSPLLITMALSLIGLVVTIVPGGGFLGVSVGISLVSLGAGVALWYQFTRRFEDLSGASTGQIHMGRARRGSATGPWRQLLAKELRLQQLPIALAALYAAACLLSAFTTDVVPRLADPRQDIVVWLYSGVIAVLVGAVSSAEERQLGTMPWQVILPVPAWRQYLLKTAVVVGLTAALALGLPLLLALPAGGDAVVLVSRPEFSLGIAGLALAGLYVSSVTGSSVKAFLGTLPFAAALVGLVVLAGPLGNPVGLWIYDSVYPALEPLATTAEGWSSREVGRVAMVAVIGLGALLAVLLWRFALANHSRAEHTSRQAVRQMAWGAVLVFVATLSMGSLMAAMTAGTMPRSSIAGVVVDERGDPVPNVVVTIVREQYALGGPVLGTRGGVRTDARGRFRVLVGRAGDYTLMALPGGFSMPAGPDGFAPTFHPDARSFDASTAITVDGRTDAGDVRLRLRSATTARLSGRLVDVDGRPVRAALLSLTPAADAAEAALAMPAFARSGPDGAFEFSGLAVGDYLLQARLEPSRNPNAVTPPAFVWQPVTLREGGEPIEVTMRPGGAMAGRIRFEGDGDRPATASVRVSGVPVDPVSVSGRSYLLNDDWTFEIGGLSGRYLLRAHAVARDSPWTMREVRLDGRDITHTPLDFRAGEMLDGLEIVLTDATAQVTGLVRVDGSPTTDYLGVLFATDPALWREPTRRVFFLSHTMRGGGFRQAGIPPGDYLIAAIQRQPGDDLRNPAFLDSLRSIATPVTLQAGETRNIDLVIAR